MGIVYYRLWDYLNRKKMKRTDLLKVITSPSLARLGKNESVNIEIIERICGFLHCQPSDIMEYEHDEK